MKTEQSKSGLGLLALGFGRCAWVEKPKFYI